MFDESSVWKRTPVVVPAPVRESRAVGVVVVPMERLPTIVDVAVVEEAKSAVTVGVPVADKFPVDVQYAKVFGEPAPVSEEPRLRHEPLIEKHPALRLIPFAKVELAVEEDTLRRSMERPPMRVEVAVVVPMNDPSVRVLEVAVILVPSNQRRDRAESEVEFVPPLAMASVPVIVPRVVVDCHVGTPLTRART